MSGAPPDPAVLGIYLLLFGIPMLIASRCRGQSVLAGLVTTAGLLLALLG